MCVCCSICLMVADEIIDLQKSIWLPQKVSQSSTKNKLAAFKKPPIGYAWQKSCLKFSKRIHDKTEIILAA